MPRAFASRATQTKRAMLRAMMTRGITISTNMLPPQIPQPAQASASSLRCANTKPALSTMRLAAEINVKMVFIRFLQRVRLSLNDLKTTSGAARMKTLARTRKDEVKTGTNFMLGQRGCQGIDPSELRNKELNWLGGRDSNPDSQIQSLESYHWTTSQQARV